MRTILFAAILILICASAWAGGFAQGGFAPGPGDINGYLRVSGNQFSVGNVSIVTTASNAKFEVWGTDTLATTPDVTFSGATAQTSNVVLGKLTTTTVASTRVSIRDRVGGEVAVFNNNRSTVSSNAISWILGNIGIGSSSPTANRLSIDGTIYAGNTTVIGGFVLCKEAEATGRIGHCTSVTAATGVCNTCVVP